MRKFSFRLPGTSRTMLFGVSPWLIVGVSSVLALAITVMAIRNTERERLHLTRNYIDRADALIWALEAGARTGAGGPIPLQVLIRETARHPGIMYMAVVDMRGRILAHSDVEMVGKTLPAGYLPPGDPPRSATWRSSMTGRRKTFEVYREFSPLKSWTNMVFNMPGPVAVQQWPTNTFALVGFDQNPFEEALENDSWLNLLTALIIASIGLCGYISLFWAYNYRRSRRMLKDTQALASQVVSNLPVGLITSDPSGYIGMCNDVALELLKADRAAVMDIPLRAIPGFDWDGIIATLRNGPILDREVELTVGESCSVISLSAARIRSSDGYFLGHLFIFNDISEVKRLQKEVRRNERLSALGNLAAGVAHEVRNPLSSIKGLATYIANKMQPGGAEEEAARTMIGEVSRLDRVVSQLLDFSRPGPVKLAEQDVHETIRHALRLADADIRSRNVTVTVSENPGFPKVYFNAERVTQALLNLFLNGVQAMEPNGELGVAVAMDAGGQHFTITVTDTGKGMSEEEQSSIFLPYFTTKSSGTGLGLSIVHQIMEGHGGSVRVVSKAGEGSAFTLVFPLKPAAQE